MAIPKFTGKLITLDGIDGVGKSTQIDRLSAHLSSTGHDVINVRDPGSTEVGKRLRAILLDSDLVLHRRTEAMLFMASRSEMIETVIRPALAAGKTVVSDRFLLANVVYQSVGGQTGSQVTSSVTTDTLWQLGRLATGGIDPEMTLLLDMSAKAAFARLGRERGREMDRMEARGETYMESVRQAFLAELPQTGGQGIVIDANQDADAVFSQIVEAIG